MKAYGKRRDEQTKRRVRGTSMGCYCCMSRATRRHNATNKFKKRARAAGKKECREES